MSWYSSKRRKEKRNVYDLVQAMVSVMIFNEIVLRPFITAENKTASTFRIF
jgi:hypothetical protein